MSLSRVLEDVIRLVDASAQHLEAVVAFESSRNHTREALLASSLGKERRELSASLVD